MVASTGAMVLRCAAGIIAPFLLLLLASGCSNAPDRPAQDAAPPAPLFYEIASADGSVEGWMIGTIHALPSGTRWQTPAIFGAIKDADLLVVEVRLGDRAKQHAVMGELATTPGLPPLTERVPSELRPQLASLLERGGLAGSQFTDQETWVIAISLAGVGAPGQAISGVDRAMIGYFTGRPIRELEGLRGQLSIFDRLPEREQRTMLAAVVRESERTRADPERLQRAWLAGNAARIEAASREGFLADAALREALLTGRNRRWVAALAPMLEDTPRPLIAVGAAHLVGEDGMVALFKAKGYRVRRIR